VVAPAAAPAQPSGEGRWIDRILTYLREQGGSDLHLTSGSQPYVRIDGEIIPLGNEAKMDAGWLLEQLLEIAPPDNRAEFQERNDTDFAYNVPGLARFRVNVFRDRNGPGAVLRTIPFKIPSAADLGLSAHILDLCYLTKGLVVVTGPTGSGKSTTLAAMIDHLNRTRRTHIITIEDPIEFVHENKMCLVNQREIRTHTRSFKDALRAALREDPDVVLVGEMRDLETIAIAVETAETGHLVFGTLHTTTAPSTVDRIIDQFPADRQEQIRTMLAKSLKGVIAQVLCKKKGGGRVAAQEILMGSSAVENLIREGKTFQLGSLMQTGKNIGMQTMNDALFELVKAGTVDAGEAYLKSVNKIEFKGQLQRGGFEI
jgi:twitching motility protein PilT